MASLKDQFGQRQRWFEDEYGQLKDENNRDTGRRDGLEEYYRGKATPYFEDQMNYGGYTDAEKERILQEQDYNSLQWSDQDAEGSFYTPDEQNEIRGNPWAAKNAYDSTGVYDTLGAGSNNRRGAWEAGSGGVNTALDRYGENINAAIGSGDQLLMDPRYAGNVRGQVEGARGEVIDPLREGKSEYKQSLGGLSISDRFRDNMTVGDDELTQIENAAGNQIQAENNAAKQDILQRAIQGGNTNAMALATLMQQRDKQADITSARAAAQAKMDAKGYKRGFEDNLEKTRLDAEGRRAGYETSGIRDFAGQQSEAAKWLAGLGIDTESGIEDRRVAGEGNRTNLRYDAANRMGGARVDEASNYRTGRSNIEGDIADKELDTAWQDTNNRVNLERDGEQTQADRAGRVVDANRQARTYNSQQRYDRNSAIYDRRSRNNQNFADARRTDRTAGATWLGNQGTQQGDWGQRGRDRATSNLNTAGTLMNNNDRTRQAEGAKPGLFDKILGVGAGIAGAYLGGK